MLIGSTIHRAAPGEVLLIPPGLRHAHGDPAKSATWSLRFELGVVDGGVRRLVTAYATPSEQGRRRVVPEPERIRWRQRFSYLLNELRRNDVDEGVVRTLLRSLLQDVARLCDPAGAAAPPGGGHAVLSAVFRYIDENFARPIGLEDVARAVTLSPAYLTDLVRRHTGRPVHRWITDRRLRAARVLLAETDASIATIATQSGFNDARNFCRRFRYATGRPPRDWRAAIRQSAKVRAADDLLWGEIVVDRAIEDHGSIRALVERLGMLADAEAITRETLATMRAIYRTSLIVIVDRGEGCDRWECADDGDELCRAEIEPLLSLVFDGQTIVARIGHAAAMMTPIRAGARCVGGIVVVSRTNRAFSAYDRGLLAMIGTMVGLALHGGTGERSGRLSRKDARCARAPQQDIITP
ncbi:helix-turn-helix domain-containing protein [bacterium]|nr:MAG: helix-turn-helix domain-containing protein [bacterium]